MCTHSHLPVHTCKLQPLVVIDVKTNRCFKVLLQGSFRRIAPSDLTKPGIVCVLQCVAVCCSVLQCVAVCCSVLQCVAVCYSMLQCVALCFSVSRIAPSDLTKPSILCVVQCVAACCSALRCIANNCNVRHERILTSSNQASSVCCSML